MKYLILLTIFLSGCVSTPELIREMPAGQSLPIPITNPTIITDLQSAAFNLDQAVAIGALAKDDPAPECLHDFLIKAGIESLQGEPEPKSFVPKNDGIASAGAIHYILTRQAAAAAKGRQAFEVGMSCKALIGQIVIDGATAVRRGVHLLSPLKALGL